MPLRCALFIVLATVYTASAADKIWSAVVLATNATAPKEAPAEVRDYAPRLQRIFGYNQFEVVGTAAEKIVDRTETRIEPTTSFWLKVKARRATSVEARGGYLLNVELFREKRQIVETEARLAPGSPLFIRGPQYGKGQLIFVLRID